MGRPEYFGEIKNRITSGADGAVYVTSDFLDIAEVKIIKVALARLEKDGTIRRVLRGIYERPRHIGLSQGGVASDSDPDKIACAIARNFDWRIVPCGNTVLHMLGLSIQASKVWTYVSDGPYKDYAFDAVTLRFKHTTDKEIMGISFENALIIQAVKALGHESADKAVDKLRSLLTVKEQRALLSEAQHTTAWVYELIKKVCT